VVGQSEEDVFADVVLLSDDPADADEFTGKAHESVALAIARLIEGEDGGRVIGLEGSWGSGKSTIVKLLCDRLEVVKPKSRRPSGTHVVVFDAWAHQGDPLRRAFLDTLISKLEGVEWLKKPVADAFRKKLSGRIRNTDTTSTPKLSWEGRLAAITALLLPLGIALFTHDFKHHHRPLQGVGLALLLLPLVVVLSFVCLKVISILFNGRSQVEKSWRRRLADLQPFDFVAKQQTAVTKTTESIEGTEPTSVEFERLFSTILETALIAHTRLLIVLDNLDRVDESDARTVLATMQTFTGARGVLPADLAARVWTLIPYDPTGLDRLWSLAASDGAGKTSMTPPETAGTTITTTSPEAAGTTITTTSLGAAFIEKLFQAHFETPPLVLSDWRGYLSKLLHKAIPSISEDDVGSVLSLRAQYVGRLPASEAPTPRQLKQFVNDLALIRARRSDIPLVHMAYYVLLRRDRFNVAEGLRARAFPADRLVPIFGPSIGGDLAALHYGTRQELGQELLLGGELDRAFDTGDATAVTRLMDHPGFVAALDVADLQSRMADGGVGITRMVATLESADAFAREDVLAWSRLRLQPTARAAPSWLLSGSDTGEGMAVLFDTLSVDQEEALVELLSKIEVEAREADADGRLQLEGAAGLSVGLARRGRFNAPLAVRLTIPPDRLVTTLASFHRLTDEEPSARELLEPTAAPDEIAKQLVESATGDAFGGVSNALDVVVTRPARVDLEALTTGTLDWLRENDPASSKQLETQLDVLDKARRYGAVDGIIAAAAQDGTLMHLVAIANDDASHALVAAASMLSLIALPSLPSAPAAPAERRTVEGTTLIEGVLTDPSAHADVSSAHQEWLVQHSVEALAILVRLAQGLPSSAPWVEFQLKELERSSQLKVSPSEYGQHWRYLNEALGDESFNQLTNALFAQNDVRRAVLSASNDVELANELLDKIGSDVPYSQEITTWASGIVKATARDTWDNELGSTSGGPSLELATRLADTPDPPSDPSNLEDALHAHFELVAAEEEAWQPEGSAFDKLSGLLSAPARAVLADRLCTTLAEYHDGIGTGVFKTYGNFLGEEASFRTHEKLPLVVAGLVSHDDWDSVSWLVNLAERHLDTLRRDPSETHMEYLTVKVAAKVQEAGDDPPPALSRLATLLGVELAVDAAAAEPDESPPTE